MEDGKLSEQLADIEQLILGVSWMEQRRFAQDIADLNLTPPQFFVLRAILAHGARPVPHETQDAPQEGVVTVATPSKARGGVPTPKGGGVPTMSALAVDTLQHCATVTGIVDRLEKMGLVTRQRDAGDRRQVLVELTAAGRELLSKIRGNREQRLRETLLRLPEEDASELLRLLRTYLEVFRLQYEPAEDAPSADAGQAQR